MCWAVYVNGERAVSRDELERLIGAEVWYLGDDTGRLPDDHCLCPVDVPATLVDAGFWVRGWREGDPGEPGDHFACDASKTNPDD